MQISAINSSCTSMDKQLYTVPTLMQTHTSSSHTSKTFSFFNLWDLTHTDNPPSSANPPPPPHAHLQYMSLSAVASSVCGCSPPLTPPRPCECLSTYLPHVLTSLSLCLTYIQRHTHTLCTCTKHTPTLLPHTL